MQNKISIAFRLNGGLGTFLMELNYILHFYEKFKDDVLISVYADKNPALNDSILRGQNFVHQYFVRQQFNANKYDIAVDINWFPKILKCNFNKIEKKSEELSEFVRAWDNFQKNSKTNIFFNDKNWIDPNIYKYAQVKNKSRLTITDTTDTLNISKSYKYKVKIFLDNDEVLNKFGLLNKKYITLQQGVNAACNTTSAPRQWSNKQYEEFSLKFKKSYPDILLVQLGELGNNTSITGVDISLLGRTGFEELKIILKNSILHIDGDCGMLHLRRTLENAGPSIALFGQLNFDITGYEEDINIVSDFCKYPCGKLNDGWKRQCPLYDRPLCMEHITAEMVINEITNFLENGKNEICVEPTNYEKILSIPNIKLDEDWCENWLKFYIIHTYWIEKISVIDLKATKLVLDLQSDEENDVDIVSKRYKYVTVPLKDMPAYQYLQGDKQSYIDYMTINTEHNPEHEHSLETFENLIKNLNYNFDKENTIVVDGMNRILDGTHRASWIMHNLGDNAEIYVLKIYWSG